MIQEKKKHKKSKKKPSAMAQVHNRVNAGVMDGVVYGGMMEAAEPEDEEYEIGMEEDGLEPYGHVVEGKKTIFITEEQLQNLKLLLEGDDRIKKVNKIMDAAFANVLNLDAPVTSSEYYVNGDQGTTWRKYILFSLRHTFGLMTNADVQYLPVVARLAFSDEVGFEKRNDNGVEIQKLQKIVNFLKKDPAFFNELKTNPGITFGEICAQLEPIFKKQDEEDLTVANSVENRSDYEIKWVPDFKTANYYGNQSCRDSKLCYTQSEGTWNSYTKNGSNKVYVCLKNGWENIPEEAGPGNPYDEYGTSMIFVFIDQFGDLAYSNCRWNHHTTGEYTSDVDHAFTKATLSQTVGVRFSDVFKPFTREELREKGIIPFEMVQELLDSGEEPENVFEMLWGPNETEGLAIGKLNKKYCFLTPDKKIVLNMWFDTVEYFENGFSRVMLNDKYNFISDDGRLVCGKWYDFVSGFKEGAAVVRVRNNYNMIDTNGNEILKETYDFISGFKDGVSIVSLNNKYNFVNFEGNLLSDNWFDKVYFPNNGLTLVVLDGKYNFLKNTGELLSNVWFDDATEFTYEFSGLAKVKLKRKYNLLNTNGDLLSDIWFDEINRFSSGIGKVKLNGKYNYITVKGNLLSKEWFDNAYDFLFNSNSAFVELNGKIYFINRNGDIVLSPLSESKARGNKTIIVTEEQMRKLGLLLEDKEGKNLAKARHYLQINGYSPEFSQKTIESIRTDIPNSRLQQCKFMLGVARLYVTRQLEDGQSVADLNKTLKYIASDAHVNEYDNNLNGEDLYTLVERFKEVSSAELQNSIEASNKRTLTANENYRIVPIDSFEEAQKYSTYTETNDSRTHWCLTHMKDMFDSYTCNGINRIYFCLRNGFENEKPIPGNGCPLDSYGLSMLSIIVGSEGDLVHCTCRWNHANGGSDNVMGVEEIENLIGRHFYQTFLPYTREELHARGVILFDELQGVIDERLKNGENLNRILNSLFTTWVGEGNPEDHDDDEDYDYEEDYVTPKRLNSGYYQVFLREKHNLVSPEGKIVFDKWLDSMTVFKIAYENDQNGVMSYDSFKELSAVSYRGKWNVIDTFGNTLWPEWRGDIKRLGADGFKTGRIFVGDDPVSYAFITVYRDDLGLNLMRPDGTILSDEWFQSLRGPSFDGYYMAYRFKNRLQNGAYVANGEQKVNLLNIRNGKLVSNQWYDEINHQKWFTDIDNEPCFHDGFCTVTLDKLSNYMDEKGRVLSETWFSYANPFSDGNAIVLLGNKKNIIDTSGNYVLKQWFDDICPFSFSGFAPVKLNGKWNFVNRNSDLLCNEWFDEFPSDYYWKRGEEYYSNTVFVIKKTDSGKNIGYYLKYNDGKMEVTGTINTLYESTSESTINTGTKILNEATDKKVDYTKYIKSLISFMREQHLNIDPIPKIELNPEEQDGIFVKTGYYSPEEHKVVVFTDGRHPKDVLRTVAHEFIHHMQNLQNPNKDWGGGGDLEEDSKLRSIEGEAFLLGNIIFREWTEKMKKTKELNESKKRKKQVKNDKGELVPETCDKCGGKVVCQIHGEPVYVCKDCGKYFGTMPCNLNEAFDVKKALKDLKKRRDPDNIENWNRIDEIEAEIVEPDDVDLSSFNIKKHLNPKFWDDGHLDTRIRLKLLDIADDFFNSLDVDWVEPEDIIITGSLANYNWNKKYSDIDLHILVDYEDVDERVDFVREYFTMKKNEWNQKHKNLKIFGFPVEVYVQDSNEPHASSGVYSIDKDKWITEPDADKIRSGKVDKRHVREMVSTYMNKIDCLIDIYKAHKDDEYEMRKVAEDASEMFNEIKKLRKDDLAKYGREMCDGNIIFKALRRSDYIGKLLKLKDLSYDKINSL